MMPIAILYYVKRTLQWPVRKPHLPSVFVPYEWEHGLLL